MVMMNGIIYICWKWLCLWTYFTFSVYWIWVEVYHKIWIIKNVLKKEILRLMTSHNSCLYLAIKQKMLKLSSEKKKKKFHRSPFNVFLPVLNHPPETWQSLCVRRLQHTPRELECCLVVQSLICSLILSRWWRWGLTSTRAQRVKWHRTVKSFKFLGDHRLQRH